MAFKPNKMKEFTDGDGCLVNLAVDPWHPKIIRIEIFKDGLTVRGFAMLNYIRNKNILKRRLSEQLQGLRNKA